MDSKEYYQKNRERILHQRAERYANDEAYRRATKERARLSSEERRISRRDDPQTIKFLRGHERYFKLMDLPEILGRNYSVIRSWNLNGTIPEPTCTIGNGRKVYAWSQVQTMAFVLKSVESGIFHLTYPQLKMIFNQRWRKKFSMPGILMDLKRMKRTENADGRSPKMVERNPSSRANRVNKGSQAYRDNRSNVTHKEGNRSHSTTGNGHERSQRKVRRSNKSAEARGATLYPR